MRFLYAGSWYEGPRGHEVETPSARDLLAAAIHFEALQPSDECREKA